MGKPVHNPVVDRCTPCNHLGCKKYQLQPLWRKRRLLQVICLYESPSQSDHTEEYPLQRFPAAVQSLAALSLLEMSIASIVPLEIAAAPDYFGREDPSTVETSKAVKMPRCDSHVVWLLQMTLCARTKSTRYCAQADRFISLSAKYPSFS